MKLTKTACFWRGYKFEIRRAALSALAVIAGAVAANAATETIASTNVNGVLVVESGDSFEVTGNMSIATTAGATGVVTNRGTMTVKDLDLGMYSGGKGALAQFDNFGTLTVANCLRMQVLGTPSVFYNHAGATVRKTGGSSYSFYFGTAGNSANRLCRLVNEGDFFDNSNEIWMGLTSKTYSDNEIIVNGNGRFFAEKNVAIGFSTDSIATITLNDNGFLSGNAAWHLGGSATDGRVYPRIDGRIVLNDSSCFAASNSVFVGRRDDCNGTIVLNDSSKMTLSKAGAYMYVGNGARSTGTLTLADNASASLWRTSLGRGTSAKGMITLSGNSRLVIDSGTSEVYFGYAENSSGSLSLSGFATADIRSPLYLGSGTKASGTTSLAGNSQLFTTNYSLIVGYSNGATGVLHVADNAVLHAPTLRVGQTYAAGTTGFATLSGNATLFSTNITIPAWGSAGRGTLEVADNAIITNLQYLKVGLDGNPNPQAVKMRGGSIYFDINPENPVYIERGYYDPLMLNENRTVVRGFIRGWGKIAFSDPRTYVTEAFNANGVATPSGVVHYGQIIADGEGVMRDLDFSRFGSLHYATTDANPSGTNGWFAVNKGRLKLPRCLPNRLGYKSVGDAFDYNVDLGGTSRRLANVFSYEFTGAETNHFVFSELYAIDRDDIPAGLDDIGAEKIIAVWRIGYFSDGPEIDEPTHPSPFTSAKLMFKYSPEGLDGLRNVYVYRHDGTADGKWVRAGARAEPSTTMPVVSTRGFESSSENWNLGWFAIVGRKQPFGSVMVLR